MKSAHFVPLFVLSLCASSSAAQAPLLTNGDRVRLKTLPFGELQKKASVVEQTADALTLANDGHPLQVIPWGTITGISLRQGRTTRQRAVHGALWGLALGASYLISPDSASKELGAPRLAAKYLVGYPALCAAFGAMFPSYRWRALDVVSVAKSAGSSMAVAAVAAKPDGGRDREGRTRPLEMTLAMVQEELQGGGFPALQASASVNFGWKPTLGVSLVGEADWAYLQNGVLGGLRVYGRSGALFTGRRTVTWFGQFLAGKIAGGQSGVVTANGGSAIQPGVGVDLDIGETSFSALRVQLDYRSVPGGKVEDSRLSPPQFGDLSGWRVVVGVTWRPSLSDSEPVGLKNP